jgi:hypothetical protein
MNRTKNGILSLVVLSPISVMAHGEDVLVTLCIDIFSILVLLIFIGLLKWKMKGKVLLLLVLILAEFLNFTIFGNIPYQRNTLLINVMSAVIPFSSVLGVFLLLRKNFSKHD